MVLCTKRAILFCREVVNKVSPSLTSLLGHILVFVLETPDVEEVMSMMAASYIGLCEHLESYCLSLIWEETRYIVQRPQSSNGTFA